MLSSPCLHSVSRSPLSDSHQEQRQNLDRHGQNHTSDEARKAQTAKPDADTIFGKIVRKEIPIDFLYEDDQVSRCLS